MDKIIIVRNTDTFMSVCMEFAQMIIATQRGADLNRYYESDYFNLKCDIKKDSLATTFIVSDK